MSSSDEGPIALPLEVDIPNEHLPEVLDVYDKQASALFRFTTPGMYSVFGKDATLMVPAGDTLQLVSIAIG